MRRQEILYRLHQLMEAKKEEKEEKKAAKPAKFDNSPAAYSQTTLDAFESDMNHVAGKIDYYTKLHAHMTQRHEEAKKRHDAGDHDWVIRNHHINVY